jgi:serine/threonine protein kinase
LAISLSYITPISLSGLGGVRGLSSLLFSAQVGRVKTEEEILEALDHPFLPTMFAKFQTNHHVNFLMEYCGGGELYHLLLKQPHARFEEAAARFYAAEVLLALQYLHLLGFIYRDLKPENVLLHENVRASDTILCRAHPVPGRDSHVQHTNQGHRVWGVAGTRDAVRLRPLVRGHNGREAHTAVGHAARARLPVDGGPQSQGAGVGETEPRRRRVICGRGGPNQEAKQKRLRGVHTHRCLYAWLAPRRGNGRTSTLTLTGGATPTGISGKKPAVSADEDYLVVAEPEVSPNTSRVVGWCCSSSSGGSLPVLSAACCFVSVGDTSGLTWSETETGGGQLVCGDRRVSESGGDQRHGT